MTYDFMLVMGGVPTITGTLDTTFDTGTSTLTRFTYTDANDGIPQTHNAIQLTGPDANGDYTGDKTFTNPFRIHGQSPRNHIHFSFNPGPTRGFFNATLGTAAHTKHVPLAADLQWQASSESVGRGRGCAATE